MGQKIHPEGIRVGYIHDWKSNWFDEKQLRRLPARGRPRSATTSRTSSSHAGLSDITIRKDAGEVAVNIHTARPGIVIGKSGSEVDALRRDLHQLTGKPVKVNIREIKRPELDAKLVAQSIAEQLQNRVAFRRAMKRALTSRDALRRQGRARSRSPVASAAPRWPAPRATPTVACRCTRCAPTSTTASSRRARRPAASASSAGSTRARSCPRASRRRPHRPRAAAAGARRGRGGGRADGRGRGRGGRGRGGRAAVRAAAAVGGGGGGGGRGGGGRGGGR